ncbi:MAG: hypothetical protein AB1750_00815 [Chloroflexota bacterium]
MKRTLPILTALLMAQTACMFLSRAEPVEFPRGDGATAVPVAVSGSLQNPAWSPDGETLLFTRFRGGYNRGPADLLLLDLASGETKTLVSDGSENINLPGSSWNPVTGQIVFASTREPHDEIYVIDAEGKPGSERRVTNRAGWVAYEPSLSPDGKWVVFESHLLDVEENGVIEKCKLDGTSCMALTDPNGDARQPNWSPAGDRIVYQSFAYGQWDLWVMNADGTNPLRVTSGAGNKTDASFSPDGKWIVFSFEEADGNAANLYVVSTRGGPPIRVTNFDGYDGAPSWSPDGKTIVFESSPGDPDDSNGTTLWAIAAPSLTFD